jgi:type III secretory pathway component EscR
MLSLTVIVVLFCMKNTVGVSYQPEQIHLSYTAVVNEMMVTWNTQLLANGSLVEYSLSNGKMNLTAKAVISKFIEGSSAHRVQYIYRAVLKNLTMNMTYSE